MINSKKLSVFGAVCLIALGAVGYLTLFSQEQVLAKNMIFYFKVAPMPVPPISGSGAETSPKITLKYDMAEDILSHWTKKRQSVGQSLSAKGYAVIGLTGKHVTYFKRLWQGEALSEGEYKIAYTMQDGEMALLESEYPVSHLDPSDLKQISYAAIQLSSYGQIIVDGLLTDRLHFVEFQ